MTTEFDAANVKRGVWTDYAKGPVLGRTITTDTGTGNIIVALLALLTTMGTAHLWNLIVFLVHQLRANGRPSDPLFRQQQTLLRTLPPPSSAIADLLKLGWTWRKKTDRSLLRTSFLVALAILFTAATITASIFSSLVVESSDLVVLADSLGCGWLSDRGSNRPYYVNSVMKSADNQIRDCYRDREATNPTEPAPFSCKSYFRSNITSDIQTAECPFNSSMCSKGAAISLDSGLRDLNDIFGLNLPDKERIRYRKKNTCAPLNPDGYSEIVPWNMTEWSLNRLPIVPTEQVAILYFGEEEVQKLNGTNIQKQITGMLSLVESNITFNMDQGESYRWSLDRDGMLRASKFIPVAAMKPSKGDFSLKLIHFNNVRFENPVNDPFFFAHVRERWQYDVVDGVLYPGYFYHPEFPMKAIGCLEQYQFCHQRANDEDFCTNLQELPGIAGKAFPQASALQTAAFEILLNVSVTFPMGVEWYSDLLGATWVKQTRLWDMQVWGAKRIAMSDYAVGVLSRDWGTTINSDDWKPPLTQGEKDLCAYQKMDISGNFVNINVFGLAYIIAFASFITILDISLPKFLIYMSRFRRPLAPRIDRWIQDGIWQLQRRAYEGEGRRDWIHLEKEIPLTTTDEKLRDLPMTWVPEKSQTDSIESASVLGVDGGDLAGSDGGSGGWRA